MAGGECHMMIGLCKVNLGGCHEGESSEPMPQAYPDVTAEEDQELKKFAKQSQFGIDANLVSSEG